MEFYDIVIVGGGPAGLAAAASAKKNKIDKILILERDCELGGILNQCIHNGFGLHTFKEELTGPEYAGRFIKEVKELGIEYRLNTMVMDISTGDESENGSNDKIATAMNRTDGLFHIAAKTVILAMGCRERARGALNIPGYRPAGIFSAGTAQRLVNIEGYMPGRKVVILGSGDIGLIMARRMTLEGAKVQVVAELMPYSGGLKRNIVQCLDDFGIPLKLSHTVVDIKGRERVGVMALAYCTSAFMDCTIAASRGLGKTVVPTVIVIMGSCVFRVIWVYTIFAHFHTIPSLYALYPCSWALTALAEIVYFAHCYKESMRIFEQPKAAA